jgi:chromosomal replication initiation ATPase DnaA
VTKKKNIRRRMAEILDVRLTDATGARQKRELRKRRQMFRQLAKREENRS